MTKKRILFIGDSVVRRTGYSTVAKNIISRLIKTDKYDIAQLGLADMPAEVPYEIDYYTQIKQHDRCCKKGKVIEYRPKGIKMPIYLSTDILDPNHIDQRPCLNGQNSMLDNYAYESAFYVIQHFKPDIVIPINDIWGLYQIALIRNRDKFKYVPYLAIDSDCMFPKLAPTDRRLPPIDVGKSVSNADNVVVFTNWANKVLDTTNKLVTGKEFDNIDVIPHGVDNSVWKPAADKAKLKKELFDLDDDTFFIGCIARNQPRKRLDAVLMTLKILKETYEPRSKKKYVAYFHCALQDNLGWNIEWLAAYYGVSDRIVTNKDLKPGIGPSDDELVNIANTFDIHYLPTNSEGWGLPILETMALGIPNVVTNYSAHADWGKGVIVPVKCAEKLHEPSTGFIKAIPDTRDAAKQIHLLSTSSTLYKDYVKKSLKLANKLDWDKITPMWEKLLDNMDVSKFKENRYDPFIVDHNNFEKPEFPKDPFNTPFELLEL